MLLEVEEELREDLASLRPEEAAVLALLEARLNRTLAGQLEDSLAALGKSTRRRTAPRAASAAR